MRIIPVMDLMGGKVVHAVRGQREQYKPIESTLTRFSDSVSIAMAFKNLGLKELYIADLDAIRSVGHNMGFIEQIAARSHMDIMLDAGFRRADEVKAYAKRGIRKIVLATETLESLKEVSKTVDRFGAQVVASIDFKFSQVISQSGALQLTVGELVKEFEANGSSEILVLSLDRVGTGQGPDYSSLKEVLEHATVPVLVGGGVRNVEDILRLGRQGVSGVLVATALHRGIITKENLGYCLQRV